MDRKELLTTLKTIAPALSDLPLIPVLTHFWFTGKSVVAYNDKIAMSMPCETEFKGAVEGKLLIDIINAGSSSAKEVTFIPIDGGQNLSVKVGNKTVLKTGLLSPDNFVFDMPKISRGKGDYKDLVEGIKVCLRSVTDDTSVPDQLGVTLIQDGQDLLLFATNHATLSHCRVKCPLEIKKNVVLSQHFCEELVKLDVDNIEIRSEQRGSYIIAHCGDVILFGKFINVQKPLDFRSIFDKHASAKVLKATYEIPSRLKGILTRACILADQPDVQTATSIAVKNGKVKFTTFGKIESARLDDEMPTPEGQSELTFSMKAKHVKAGIDDFSKMIITKDCLILHDKNRTYLVSSSEH
jgi:DNA polymerase III sliding clamp (beta) subunit (PCNA family)